MAAEVCDSCLDALWDAGAGKYDAEGYPLGYRGGDDAGLYDTVAPDPAILAREGGADLPDHECETWLYGGRPCVCSCHPQGRSHRMSG